MKKIRRSLAIILALLMALTLFAGCGVTSTSTVDGGDDSTDAADTADTEKTDDGSDEAYKICFVTPVVAENPAYIKIIDLCEASLKEYQDYDVEFSYVDGKSDTATQISGIESAIINDIDLIVIDPIEGEAVKAYVEEAQAEGIFILSINANLDVYDAQRLLDQTYLGTLIGTEAASFINDDLGGNAKIGLLHNEENTNLVLRENGIRQALEELCPDCEIVAEATADNQTDGMTGAENILQAQPDVQVIICTNGSAALGAYEGALGMGIAKDAENFGIFASDCADEELQLISENTIYRCTVDLFAELGSSIIGTAMDMLTGKDYEESAIMPMTLVNRDNISDYIS